MAGKRKVRLNIIDFLLIALLILAVIAIFLRPTVVEQIGKLSANETVVVRFVAENVSAAQIDKMAEGDLLACNGERFGELRSFTASPSEVLQLVDPEGTGEHAYYQKVILPEQNTVSGQLRLIGNNKENGFYVGGNTYIGVGTVLYLTADSYVMTVQITGIS